jgi:hypothetical protein
MDQARRHVPLSLGDTALDQAEMDARRAEMQEYLASITSLEFLQAVLDHAHAEHKAGRSCVMHHLAWDRWRAIRCVLGVDTYRTDREGFLDLCSDLVRRERERVTQEMKRRLTT